MYRRYISLCFIAFGIVGCMNNSSSIKTKEFGLTSPVAKKISTTRIYHGEVYNDDYAWLRDPEYPNVSDPKILNHLNKEQKSTNQFFADYKDLTATVFEEIKSRVPKNDKPLTWEDNSYIYSSEYGKNAKYKTWYVENKKTGVRSLLIDEAKRAAGLAAYELQKFEVSPDGSYLAWIEDVTGSGYGTIYFKSLSTGNVLTKSIKNIGTELVWTQDSKSIYYLALDDSNREYQLKIHHVAQPNVMDKIIYTEQDQSYFVYINKSQSGDILFLSSSTNEITETRVIRLNQKENIPILIIKRELGSHHIIDHFGNAVYLTTNYFNSNYDVVSFSDALLTNQVVVEKWKKYVEKDEESYIRNTYVFDKFIAIHERKKGKDQLRIVDTATKSSHYVQFEESVFGVTFYDLNQSRHSDKIRLRYESFLTPETIYDYNAISRTLEVIDQALVVHFDKKDYHMEVIQVPSFDGVKVPVSVIYKKSFGLNKANPLYLYVYGAYGEGIPPEFPVFALSAINRGFTYAIVHVRGGDELGKQWHDQGKMLNRKNTFKDFLAVANYFVDKGYVARGNISVSGESAGGQIIGVALNQEPSLFKSVAMLVPFVDVLNTLMDDSLEYTIGDWSEFGNPIESLEVFNYMKSYSPYDNVSKQVYPHIYATAGLNDSAVGYWEPTKWLAKIKENQVNDSEIILNIKLGGHVDSGRYAVYKDFAQLISFLLITNNATELKD